LSAETETSKRNIQQAYAEWRQVVTQKEQHLIALREERMQAREALRRAAGAEAGRAAT